jgi:hypothetical protein
MATRSREELEKLKADWLGDDCWNLEDAEGFEDHRDELAAFREASQAERKQQEQQRREARAAELGCSVALLTTIEGLKSQLDRLEQKVEKTEDYILGRIPPRSG